MAVQVWTLFFIYCEYQVNDSSVSYYCIHLIGLPPRYRDSVRAITPGLPLFLYNYTTHQLHGIFEVCSHFFIFILFISFAILLVVQGGFSVDYQIFSNKDYHIIIFPFILIERPQCSLSLSYFYSFDSWGDKCCRGQLLLYLSCLSTMSLLKEIFSCC